MNDDIVARLRNEAFITHMAKLPRESKILHEAADEIERLRVELGQVSDADAFVSETDAMILDGMMNWCEFNDMNWHRALARLVADRARLRAEVLRLRALIKKQEEE